MQAKYRSGFQCGYRLDQGQRQNKKIFSLLMGLWVNFLGENGGGFGVTTFHTRTWNKKNLPYMLTTLPKD